MSASSKDHHSQRCRRFFEERTDTCHGFGMQWDLKECHQRAGVRRETSITNARQYLNIWLFEPRYHTDSDTNTISLYNSIWSPNRKGSTDLSATREGLEDRPNRMTCSARTDAWKMQVDCCIPSVKRNLRAGNTTIAILHSPAR